MIGLILSFILVILTIVFSSIPIEGAILISSKILFWWYLILSLPKIIFSLFILSVVLFMSSVAMANMIARSNIGKLFGFGTLMMVGGGVSVIFAIDILAANIFLIGGAYLISTGINANPFWELGVYYEYDFVRLALGAISIIFGIFLKRKSRLGISRGEPKTVN